MRRTALVWLSFLLAFSKTAGQTSKPAQPAEAAQPTLGLLLGVADEVGVGDYRGPQQLTTSWIVVSSAGARPPVTMPGLVVPRDEGFVRVAVRRQCERMETDNHHAGPNPENCEDWILTSALSTTPKPQAPPSTAEPAELEVPCAYTRRYVTFASPALLSVVARSRRSETCEPARLPLEVTAPRCDE